MENLYIFKINFIYQTSEGKNWDFKPGQKRILRPNLMNCGKQLDQCEPSGT